jgi:hypothetical protein
MGTDFNIKPVGVPVAAPFVSTASATAQKAVATELPTSQSVTAPEPTTGTTMGSDGANGSPSNPDASVSNKVLIDNGAGAVVYQVVDNRTNLVIRQYPEEATLRSRAYYRTLDLSKDPSSRGRATDREV